VQEDDPVEVEVHALTVQQRLGKVPTHETVVPAMRCNQIIIGRRREGRVNDSWERM
jgi:hypothetical protein